MEYHSDRFDDYSLMIYSDKGKLLCVLPANYHDDSIYSHQGLTFGGFLTDEKMTPAMMLLVFGNVIKFAKDENLNKLEYKCIPYPYHKKPAEEDRYALFRFDSKLVRRDVSSTVYLQEQIRYSKGRKWSVNKGKKEGVEVYRSENFDVFWPILENVLALNHGEKPVHSLDEIKMLSHRFPENIQLYLASKGDVLAGSVLYINENIVHTQYLASTDEGKAIGAMDILIDRLIKEKFKNYKYFDFGISNESRGRYLNEGLVAQKEGFGARSVVHDFYELTL